MDALVARLESGDRAAFEQLCQALVSPDNEARRQAEDFYKKLLEHKPDLGVRFLANGLSDSAADLKHFCCVYLRKAVRAQGVWDGCSAETKELVKTHGMKCLAEEKNPALMSQLADCMSQVANQTWQNEQERWVGVLQHLQQFIMSDDPHLLEVALTLYAKLTEWLSQEDVKNAAQMYEVLLRCLQHPNRRVQLAAATASVSFINSFEEEHVMLRLEGLVPPMFALSAALVQDNAEVEARDILLQLLDVAETEPRLFRKDFASHLTMLLAIMRGRIGEGEELDMETRLAALEVVVTLVEKRPAFVRKDEPQLRAVITGMMELLLELEVTEVWHNAIEEEDLDNGQTELYEASLQSLDRIARPIGGKFLLGCLWPLITAWSKDADWRKRAGALCAIAQIAEGCRKALLPDAHLAGLMGICCGAIGDSHAFVKWSACQAIGQVCTDLATKVQRKHHEDMVKALMHLMRSEQEPRVQAHAASAVVNFCEGLDETTGSNIVGRYIKPLSEHLVVLLQTSNQLVVEGALTATSSIADSAGELYTPYYDATMPLLKHILASAKGKTQRRLCGKALECISLIAMSVGRETFQKDAQDFMLYLRQLNTMDMDSDNPLLTYVQSAGTRMCKCLGEDFLPMLPDFVPPLIRSAGKKSTFQVLAKDDPKADEDDEDYVSYPVGEHIFRVSTAHTEEKANALNMLSCYAEHMGHSFAPYCMDVAATVEHVLSTPLLNNEEMRSTAAGLVPLLLGCMQDAHKQSSFAEATPEAVQALFGLLMKGLVSALGAEVDTDVLHSLYEGLEESLDAAVDGLITPAFMEQCFPKIEDQVASLMGARQERAEERGGPDLDEEDLEQMNEAEEAEAELLQQVVAAIGGFLKCLGDVALPRVEALVQKYFNPLLAQAARGHEDRWVALLVISDCLEYAPGSQKHLPALLPELVKHAQSDSHDVANVCIYTLGVIAEKYPAVYAQHHDELLPLILKTIEGHQGDDDWDVPRDNAVAALGKVLFHHEARLAGPPGLQLAKAWVDKLPLTCDEVEAGKQHELLRQFLLRNDSRVLGESMSNLPQIANVFVEVIGKGDQLLMEDHAQEFRNFFAHQLRPVLEQNGCNVQDLVGQLEAGDQHRFVSAFSNAA